MLGIGYNDYMKKHAQHRKICDSWYHQKWFRTLLVIVGLDMVVVGVAFALGLDILSFIQNFPTILRIIGGLAYVVVAGFIIYYALSYNRFHKESYLVCQHCAHVK